MNAYTLKKNLYTLLAMLFVFVITACGGGGGGGGNNTANADNEAPVVSDDSVLPGQLISISHSSISGDDIVDITFETDGAQITAINEDTPVVTLKGIAHEDGVVDVAVPLFFDINGLPVARDVHVLVNGVRSTSLLHVESLPELPFATGGAVLEAVLSASIDYYENALDNIDQIATQLGGALDPSDVQAAIEDLILDLDDQLFELEVLGTYTVEVDGVTRTLSSQELETLDHWLLYSLVSIDAASDVANGNVVVAAETQPNTTEVLRDAWNRAVAAVEQERLVPDGVRDFVTKGVPDVLNKAKDGLRKGTTFIFGYLSLMTTGAGALGDELLGVAATARNMANAQISAMLSLFNSYVADLSTDSFLSDDGEGFNFGQELFSQGIRLVTAYLGAFPGQLGKEAGYTNTALSVKDMLTEAQVELCDVLGAVASLCTGSGNNPGSAITVLVYLNFDGSQKDSSNSGGFIDPLEADIKLSGNAATPSVSWPGGSALALTVMDTSTTELVYGITSAQGSGGNLVPFNSPVAYGDYNLSDINIEGTFPSSELLAGRIYQFFVQRSDFLSATLLVQVN